MVLATLPTEFDASIIASVLNDQNIETRIVGGNLEALGPMAPTRKIELAVPEDRAEEAAEILTDLFARAAERELALNAKGGCVTCGYDMSALSDQDMCPECGTNLRQLAERFRRQGFLFTAQPGGLRQVGAAGRVFAVLILATLVIPMGIMIVTTVSSTFVGTMTAVSLLVLLGGAIWMSRQFRR